MRVKTSLSSSHPLVPLLCLQVRSLCQHLYSCPANKFIGTIFLDSIFIRINVQYSCFLLLTSLCITGCKRIHLTKTDPNVLLFVAECCTIVCTCHNVCTHSFVDGHQLLPCPGCCKQRCREHWDTRVVLCFSQVIGPVVELLGRMVVLFLVFKAVSILFSIVAISIYIPTNGAKGFPFRHILSSMYYF